MTDTPGDTEHPPLDLQRPLDEGRPVEAGYARPAAAAATATTPAVPAPAAAPPVESTGVAPTDPTTDRAPAPSGEDPSSAPADPGSADEPTTVVLRPAVPAGDLAGEASGSSEADPTGANSTGTDITEPESAESDTTELESAAPESARSEAAGPGSTTPETAPGSAAAGSTTPGSTEPGSTEPTVDLDAPADPVTLPLLVAVRRRVTLAARTAAAAVGGRLRALAAWARGPSGRMVLPGLLTAVLLAGSVSTGAVLIPAAWSPTEQPPPPPGPGAPVVAPSPGAPPVVIPPVNAPGATPVNNHRPAPLTAWAEEMSDRTGIPVVAVQAYGYAELVVAETHPECNLRWTTLAGIGRVESAHGSSGGATLLPDGRALPPIVGLPLDGEGGRMLIPDTDRGELDFDTVYDRAVGPMQFIPTTWRFEAVDGNGDGIADVHNIFDAALAAANYLCRGRNLADATQWREAIHAYNNVTSYVNAVFAAANEYGRRSQNG